MRWVVCGWAAIHGLTGTLDDSFDHVLIGFGCGAAVYQRGNQGVDFSRCELAVDGFDVVEAQLAGVGFELQAAGEVVVARIQEVRHGAEYLDLRVEHIDDGARADLVARFGRGEAGAGGFDRLFVGGDFADAREHTTKIIGGALLYAAA